VNPGRARLFVQFARVTRTPVGAALGRRLGGPLDTIDVLGHVSEGMSIFVLWRKGTQIIVGASLAAAPLQTALARLRAQRDSYEIVRVPVLDVN